MPLNTQAPAGYEQLTVSSSSVPLASVPIQATGAVISVETAAVRYRDDGSAPTASVGMPLASGASFTYAGKLSALRFIAQSGDAKVNVSYFVARNP